MAQARQGLLMGNIRRMHLLLRTLLHLFLAARRPPTSIWVESSLALRVLPTDMDLAGHINNGMYFSLMDLARMDLMVRSGAWARMRARGWRPVASAETIAFRKSLKLFQRYSIETKVMGADEKVIYFEHRMVADGEIYARAHVATRLVSKNGPVSNAEIFAEFGHPPADLMLPDWIHDWRDANALPSTRRSAPHEWAWGLWRAGAGPDRQGEWPDDVEQGHLHHSCRLGWPGHTGRQRCVARCCGRHQRRGPTPTAGR